MKIKRTIWIATLIVAIPFINATGSDFTVYIPKSSDRLERHLQFSHGFYSSLQFMPNDIVRHSYGIYTIQNNTVFMLSLNKFYKFQDSKQTSARVIEKNSKDYLSKINVIQINEKNNTIYLSKRFEYEKLDNVKISGQMGFW